MFDVKMGSQIRKRVFSMTVFEKIEQDVKLCAGKAVFFVFPVQAGFQLIVYFFKIISPFSHGTLLTVDM